MLSKVTMYGVVIWDIDLRQTPEICTTRARVC